ncbi:MAG: hypothetical protein QM765_23090 [Myxococcales bacterium]
MAKSAAVLLLPLALWLTACPPPPPAVVCGVDENGVDTCVAGEDAGEGEDAASADAKVTLRQDAGRFDASVRPDASQAPDVGPADTGPCVPETEGELCKRLGKSCDPLSATDNCQKPRQVDCGTCTAPQTCGGGGTANVCSCPGQTDVQFCAALGKDCGQVTANDACGLPRTTSCGTCTAPKTCGAANVCVCVPESDAEFCLAKAKNCGTVSGTDRCGAARNASCGTCANGWDCTGNVCIDHSCTPETDLAFCQRLGKQCGPVTDFDNCGTSRPVASCGNCTSPKVCSAGTCCTPETDAVFCSRQGKQCGAFSGTDNCGNSRNVASCGGCTSPKTCTAGQCACTGETVASYCASQGKNCGAVSWTDACGASRSGSCGTCSGSATCSAAGKCVSPPGLEIELTWPGAVDLDLFVGIGDAEPCNYAKLCYSYNCESTSSPRLDWDGVAGVTAGDPLLSGSGATASPRKVTVQAPKDGFYSVFVENQNTSSGEGTVTIKVGGVVQYTFTRWMRYNGHLWDVARIIWTGGAGLVYITNDSIPDFDCGVGSCSSDDPCDRYSPYPDRQYCSLLGRCATGCASSMDCSGSTYCDKSHECVTGVPPWGSTCTVQGGCMGRFTCDPVSHECTELCGTTDVQCYGGGVCCPASLMPRCADTWGLGFGGLCDYNP